MGSYLRMYFMLLSTEKTNSFRITRKKYKTMAEKHLSQSAREIYREKVTYIFEDARVVVDAIGFIISKNEVIHINESLKNLFQHPKSSSKTTQN